MKSDENSSLVSFKSLAERLGCSPASLRSMINRGEGPPFIIVGAQKKFRQTSIDSWLKRRERESAKTLRHNRELVEKFAHANSSQARCDDA